MSEVKHRLMMIAGWFCLYVLLIVPLRWWDRIGLTSVILPLAGYYAHDESHTTQENIG